MAPYLALVNNPAEHPRPGPSHLDGAQTLLWAAVRDGAVVGYVQRNGMGALGPATR